MKTMSLKVCFRVSSHDYCQYSWLLLLLLLVPITIADTVSYNFNFVLLLSVKKRLGRNAGRRSWPCYLEGNDAQSLKQNALVSSVLCHDSARVLSECI